MGQKERWVFLDGMGHQEMTVSWGRDIISKGTSELAISPPGDVCHEGLSHLF